MKRILNRILLLLLASTAYLAQAAPRDLGAFSNVRTSAARMPFYRDNQLEFYLRCQSLSMRGRQLDAAWPLVDAIRKGISVETVSQSDNSSNVYKLGSPTGEVLNYWAQRSYSEGVIVSESASLDQASRIVSGKDKVFLRSPMMDLDGIGFTADLQNKTVTVNSNVEIVLRSSGNRSLASPLNVVKDAPAANDKTELPQQTRVYGDKLTLDIARNTIILSDNVQVFDPAGTITAERLEIEFADRNQTKNQPGLSATGTAKKLRSARFIGNVRAVRQLDPHEAADGEQYATADLAVYTAENDSLELTGSRPRLSRGQDFAEADRILLHPEKKIIRFFDHCVFEIHSRQNDSSAETEKPDVITADYADWNYPENLIRLIGKTSLTSPSQQAKMQADRLEITLADDRAKAADSSTSGQLKVNKVLALGNVDLQRNSENISERASAGRMTYWADNEKIVLEDSPVLSRNEDKISGDVLTYTVAQERMIIERNSRIVLSAATVSNGSQSVSGKQAADPGPVTVDSQYADLNYKGNHIAFANTVRINGRGMKMESDKLDIFLRDVPGRKSSTASADLQDLSGNKQPVRALASGNVRAEDNSGILKSKTLEIFFGDRAVPGKVDVEKIIADGNMHLQSKPDQQSGSSSPTAPAGNTLLGRSADGTTSLDARRGVIDLLTHKADFYENVTVKDSAVKLECSHLEAFAKPLTSAVPSIESFRSRDEFPDRLAIGNDRELLKIISSDNVRLSRTLPSGEVQRARGDKAEYTVKDRQITLTCEPPRRPQAVTADSGMIGERVTIDLDNEELFVENGDVLTRINDMEF